MRVWEASTVPPFGGELRAQGLGTAAQLVLRLKADDPVWHGEVELRRAAVWPTELFRRGLAIQHFPGR
jgi:hypothetical protein